MIVRHYFNSLAVTLALSVLFQISCHKSKAGNNGALPPATQTGAQVMACYLDGIPWIIEQYNHNTGVWSAGRYGDTISVAGYPQLGSSNFQHVFILALHLFGDLKKGSRYDATDSSHVIFRYAPDSTCLGVNFNAPNLYPCDGSITLTRFDTINHIFSGTFSARFAVSGCDTTAATDGWFDVRY
jgi:hypothetical protein